MAQHIGCVMVDENGNVLNGSGLNFNTLHDLLCDFDRQGKKLPWLTSIDDYGDTIFNWRQIPYVLEELKIFKIEDIVSDPSLISDFIEYIEQMEWTHRYLKFIGD